MNNGVCRTAPATPDLLNVIVSRTLLIHYIQNKQCQLNSKGRFTTTTQIKKMHFFLQKQKSAIFIVPPKVDKMAKYLKLTKNLVQNQ